MRVAVVLAALVLAVPVGGAHEETPFALGEAPPAVRAALRALRDAPARGERAAAARKLSEITEAEPYLRAFCATPAGKLEDAGSDALAVLQAARAKRNAKRLDAWAKEGRFDLMVDAGLDLSDTDDIYAFGDHLLKLGKDARDVPKKFGAPEGYHRLVDRTKHLIGFGGDFVNLADPVSIKSDHVGPAFVRTRSCEATGRIRLHWLVATRDELKGTNPPNHWENCFLFHNNDLQLEDITGSFVVCDGDVEFLQSVGGAFTTIIARGSIRAKGGITFTHGTYFAHGDITAKHTDTMRGLLMACGKIDVPLHQRAKDKKAPERVIKAGVKENPFGVRFFETADVGTEAAFKDGALTIGKLTPGSPLTKFGVKPGDVVTQLNDKPIKTANDFRRELRNSVALEAGIFYITRDGTKITRVVYFHNGLEK